MHWDFALILLFFATAVPLLGRRRIRQLTALHQTTKVDRLRLYASTVAFQWAAVAVILWRTTAHGIPASELGADAPDPEQVLVASVLLSALVLANQVVALRLLTTRASQSDNLLRHLATKIFPQDNIERLAFLAVVITVSVCEELIYRGFAEHVLARALGNYVLSGIFGSSILFAVAHAYQGRRGLIATFVVGVLFASVRALTASLLPPMIAHFATDLAAGYLAPGRVRASSPLSDVAGASK